MNNIDTLNNLIVVLNDNKMSISKMSVLVPLSDRTVLEFLEYNREKPIPKVFCLPFLWWGAPLVRASQGGRAEPPPLLLYHSTEF